MEHCSKKQRESASYLTGAYQGLNYWGSQQQWSKLLGARTNISNFNKNFDSKLFWGAAAPPVDTALLGKIRSNFKPQIFRLCNQLWFWVWSSKNEFYKIDFLTNFDMPGRRCACWSKLWRAHVRGSQSSLENMP